MPKIPETRFFGMLLGLIYAKDPRNKILLNAPWALEELPVLIYFEEPQNKILWRASGPNLCPRAPKQDSLECSQAWFMHKSPETGILIHFEKLRVKFFWKSPDRNYFNKPWSGLLIIPKTVYIACSQRPGWLEIFFVTSWMVRPKFPSPLFTCLQTISRVSCMKFILKTNIMHAYILFCSN